MYNEIDNLKKWKIDGEILVSPYVITMPIELSDGTLLATTDNEVLLFEESHVM